MVFISHCMLNQFQINLEGLACRRRFTAKLREITIDDDGMEDYGLERRQPGDNRFNIFLFFM